VLLPSHLVAYSAPTTSTTSSTSTTVAAPVEQAPSPPVVTTTTEAPVPHALIQNNSEHGWATWYAAAPAGKCASPTLPFGTVLTVTNDANGESTVCVVDDREAAGYPHVVDLSYWGFSQIAYPGQGVVDVTISW
jgi:rare lipoprotein A (peptidoglycan hydrolase)